MKRRQFLGSSLLSVGALVSKALAGQSIGSEASKRQKQVQKAPAPELLPRLRQLADGGS